MHAVVSSSAVRGMSITVLQVRRQSLYKDSLSSNVVGMVNGEPRDLSLPEGKPASPSHWGRDHWSFAF